MPARVVIFPSRTKARLVLNRPLGSSLSFADVWDPDQLWRPGLEDLAFINIIVSGIWQLRRGKVLDVMNRLAQPWCNAINH